MGRLHSCWSPPPPHSPTRTHLCRLIHFVWLVLLLFYFLPHHRNLWLFPGFIPPCVSVTFIWLLLAFSLSVFSSFSYAFFSWGPTSRLTTSSCTARPRWRHGLIRQWSSSGSDLCRKRVSVPGWRNHLSRNSSCSQSKEQCVYVCERETEWECDIFKVKLLHIHNQHPHLDFSHWNIPW